MSVLELIARKNALEYQSPYGYTPSLAPGVAYLVVFSLLALIHLVLGIKYKYWIIAVTLLPGGIREYQYSWIEIVGWAGRLWSHYSVLNSNPFIMQICTLILGPAFFSAWAYATLGYCIQRLGPRFSLLKPTMYLAVFVTADVVSLILQAIGGGKAAVQAEAGTDTTQATHIMLAGILFQLGTMTIFVALASDFIIRVAANRPYKQRTPRATKPEEDANSDNVADSVTLRVDPEHGVQSREKSTSSSRKDLQRVKVLLGGVAFASLMIYIRGVYRSIELAQGWTGYVITHEAFFTWLDGFPMVLCYAAFAIAHPGWLLPRRSGWRNA
ncbi:RTA1 like protein-domain-containing protein [Kockovaella imperatae]|uniref:RTA1 like protein-domain-containing protein n=1 Tax=Kockovaella imperatae TaxID=4999 RepID=A0A1Y1UFD3_9TREE|nr:RTA1 like protein-domain-containing protein [Kockovaella imperatae]ORX36216.1 RTA1 like protein-domain-containing protein [Kockovaella imperatae]